MRRIVKTFSVSFGAAVLPIFLLAVREAGAAPPPPSVPAGNPWIDAGLMIGIGGFGAWKIWKMFRLPKKDAGDRE